MAGFKEKLKSRLHLHASGPQQAAADQEPFVHHDSSAHHKTAHADLSASGSPSRDLNEHQLQSARSSITNDDTSLQRHRTNTSVNSSTQDPKSPSRIQKPSASNSITSLPVESPTTHRKSTSVNTHSFNQSDIPQDKALGTSQYPSSSAAAVPRNDRLIGTACFDYGAGSVKQAQPSQSASASIQSRAGSTLENSTWTETLPSSIDEKPELTLQEPSPESLGSVPTVAERLIQQESYVTTLPTSTAVYTPTTTQSNSSQSSNRMGMRKIWVKRPGAAATLVSVRDDDMVDDAKDMILRKYGNSLGRQFDAPDVVVKLVPRDAAPEVILSPDDELCRAIDKYYHGTQRMHEALIVHVPQKKTPRHSPGGHLMYHHHNNAHYGAADDSRPHESGTDYFPLVHPANASPNQSALHDPRSIAVLTTGQLPPLASPGGSRRALAARAARPTFVRHTTSSPTALTSVPHQRNNNRPRLDSASSDKHSPQLPTAPALTPPIAENPKNVPMPPTPRVASPRPRNRRLRPKHSPVAEEPKPALPLSILDTSVPPINVLIVEDNMINMKLLEQFVRRLKVHWATAVNGREAVQKWRQGGFHLVLMDIQLPIMSGLDATREIRRLERVNHIGVLSGSSHSSTPPTLTESSSTEVSDEVKDEDKLADTGRMFKSPVIIVALTASNLQSDRHEALAAGCNDFLTKPVNFVWFERKVKEWGCMQALIDFDGWRKWKDNAVLNGLKDASNSKQGIGAGAGAAARRVASKPDKQPAAPSSAAAAAAGVSAATNSNNNSTQAAAAPPSSLSNNSSESHTSEGSNNVTSGYTADTEVARDHKSVTPNLVKDDSGDTVTA